MEKSFFSKNFKNIDVDWNNNKKLIGSKWFMDNKSLSKDQGTCG